MPSSSNAQPLLSIAGLAGSLRRSSFNRQLLEVARRRAPKSIRLELFEGLSQVPLFSEDLEADGTPNAVASMRDQIAQADGLIIATPEYNQSLPGVVKNAIDWLSRASPSPLAGKPVAITGASIGLWGTRLAQAALRQTLTACGAVIMPAPQLYLRHAGDAFADEDLADPAVCAQLDALLVAFREWVIAHRASSTRR